MTRPTDSLKHPDGPEGSSDEWSVLKSLWFAIEDVSPAEQQRLLDAPDVPPDVRAQLVRMLAVMPSVGVRFDAPAHIALGFEPTRGADIRSTASVGDTADGEGSTARLVGQRLGPYRVVRLVGRGGMGAVYEAERDDAQYTQRVAIKTIWRGADSEVLLQRFRSERQILAALQHPNIAALVDGGATDTGSPWLAMEFVDGVPLDAYCDQHALSIPARLDLFRSVCQAVYHAHQRLVVHRDLKPSNVMVTADGTVKLLDFGVAKLLDDSGATGTLTAEGLSPFTAAYAAPEQVSGDLASTATDVYALGALLCTLLTGSPPIEVNGRNAMDRLLEVRNGTPRAPSTIARSASEHEARARGFDSPRKLAAALDGELDAIVSQALRRDPAKRYQSARDFSEDVLRYLRRDRVHARPDTLAYRAWAFTRRRRTVVLSAVIATVTLFGGSFGALRQARSLRAEAERAERAATFMAGLMSGTSTVLQDPILRVGPAGTVAQLLDSAVTRLPREFPNDDRIRARLYTAFGANYSSQGRYAMAHVVLDSARILAERAYGAASDEYAAASLEAASLEMDFLGPEAATAGIDAATRSTGAAIANSVLSTRVLLLRARQALSRGQMRLADSLARTVVDIERRERGVTNVLASAENVRLAAVSWTTRDPRQYLNRARLLESLMDSLDMQNSLERNQVADAAIEAMLVLGRADSAEARMRAQALQLRGSFGPLIAVRMWSAKADAGLSAIRGDTAGRRIALARGRVLLDSLQQLPMTARTTFSSAYVDDALQRKDLTAALSMAEATRDALLPSRSPLYLSFAHLYVGVTHLAMGDAKAAEADLRAGLAVVATVADLASMGPRLRRPLADALAMQGRTAEADALRKQDPPRGTMPDCTPGGKWLGCPDVPVR